MWKRSKSGKQIKIINHLIPFYGLWIILAPYIDLLWIPLIFYVSMGHSTISAQFRLHMWGKSEPFPTSNISGWVFTIPCSLVTSLFLGVSLPLIFFGPFILIVVWMVHVHSIKFPLNIVIGAPIPILDISGNLILLFIESPGFKIVKLLRINIFGVPSFSVDTGLGSVTSSYLNCFKDRILILI